VTELPKQILPTTLLMDEVARGFDDRIRESVLLVRAFGVSKEIVLNAVCSAVISSGGRP
jgi:hypothetical protein